MRLSRVVPAGCLAAGLLLVNNTAFAQFGIPKLPGMKRKDPAHKKAEGGDEGVQAKGVPVPIDSPVFEAFRRLDQATVYHQRMKLTVNDPQAEQMMTQMGFGPAETIVAGGAKQVSMHFKMPALGQVEDFELRAVSRDGRLAKKWISPGSDRILKEQDAALAKQLAQQEEQAAKSIARNLAGNGPLGLVSAGVSAAGAAASLAAAAKIKKQAHDLFEWTCMDNPGAAAPAQHGDAPPLTDLRVIGDQTLDGIAVTSYEFFVRESGKFRGPVQLHVARETGLPLRIAMSDPRGGGSMQMDYYGFNQGEIEAPACLAEHK